MNIRHHPDELYLARLASGGLDPALAMVVRAHLDRCACCRGDVAALTAAGGVLLDGLSPAAMQDDALARALAGIGTPEAPPAPSPPLLGRRKDIAFGIWYRPLHWDRLSRMRAYELHVPAGRRMPVHSHSGTELTCIVQGSFSDMTGHYDTGDFIATDETLEHAPHAGSDMDCVCVIASDGPLRMKGLIARSMQLYLQI